LSDAVMVRIAQLLPAELWGAYAMLMAQQG
jgi:hypothetical protein